jgi:peptidoglycan/xylan/chitin deacetylase (PgdA/CDA1 family)
MVLITILFWTNENMLFLLFITFLIFFIILSAGVLFLRFNYFVKAICKTSKPYVLLTFDDGPDPKTTPAVLDTLKKFDVKAIFFIIGKKVEDNPELIERIIKEGHSIGNHTYSHPPIFALMNAEKVKEELLRFDEVLMQKGVKTNVFRPPIGYTNPIIARVVKALNLQVIGWNKRSYDTVIFNPKRLSKRLIAQSTPGSIILMHDNLKQTMEALPSFLESAKEKGTIFANELDIKSMVNEKS